MIQRKELLGAKRALDSTLSEIDSYKLERSDIREAFKELKIVKKFKVPRTRSSFSHSRHQREISQPFLEQETLIDQI